MRKAALLALLSVVVAVAMATDPSKCNSTMAAEPGMEEMHASLIQAEKVLSEVDFLRVPFDPINNADDAKSTFVFHFKLLTLSLPYSPLFFLTICDIHCYHLLMPCSRPV